MAGPQMVRTPRCGVRRSVCTCTFGRAGVAAGATELRRQVAWRNRVSGGGANGRDVALRRPPLGWHVHFRASWRRSWRNRVAKTSGVAKLEFRHEGQMVGLILPSAIAEPARPTFNVQHPMDGAVR